MIWLGPRRVVASGCRSNWHRSGKLVMWLVGKRIRAVGVSSGMERESTDRLGEQLYRLIADIPGGTEEGWRSIVDRAEVRVGLDSLCCERGKLERSTT